MKKTAVVVCYGFSHYSTGRLLRRGFRLKSEARDRTLARTGPHSRLLHPSLPETASAKIVHKCDISHLCYITLVLYYKCGGWRKMRIDIKSYLEDNGLTIYVIAKKSGYGYTTLHKSFNKKQSSATSINLRDIEAIAKAQDIEMWRVLRELELHYLK